jgi:restriction system protein
MMQPTIDALRALGGQATNDHIHNYVTTQLQLPVEVVARLHKEGQRQTEVEYRLQWTRTYLQRYGLIQKIDVGKWALTEQGRQCEEIVSAIVVKTVRAQLKAERKAKNSQPQPNDGTDPTKPTRGQVSVSGAVPDSDDIISPTPLFPTYAEARYFLRLLNGVPYAQYRSMYNQIWVQRGSPQEQVDWANPNEWIPNRLHGKEQELAYRLYRESQGKLNPRHSRGCWFFVTKHNLLGRDSTECLYITEKGQEFLEQPNGKLVASIDTFEGVLVVLRLVAEKAPARHSDLLGEYSDYSRTHTTFQSDSVLKSSLYVRLRNLIDRGLITNRGQRYEITEAGLNYLQRNAQLPHDTGKPRETLSDIHRLAKDLRDEARRQLYSYLLGMNPFHFEHVVKQLLEEMGYTNVETTSPSNDKGVDVVAHIELGISSVREVIQVKRHRGTIIRPVLDQLRGSLHRFNAVRGTIITTGHFSKGAQEAAFERGVAPITLIDGEKLLILLESNQIGVRKYTVEYFDFAPDKLAQYGTSETELRTGEE